MARCARSACGRWRPTTLARHGRVGVTFADQWFCSAACLEAAAEAAINEARHYDCWVSVPSTPLGRLLVQRNAVAADTVEVALEAQRETGRRLGAELIAMRATSPEQVLSALAAQAGIGCLATLDLSRVTAGPGGLSPETVRLLGVVPFDANHAVQRLSVACVSPLPGWALAAVREVTSYQVQPFLVSDDMLAHLMDVYGSARGRDRPVHRPVRSVAAAAATVAEAAQQGLAQRMQQVRFGRFVWVRLEGESHAEDLMVTLEPPRTEDSWQAAPTPH